MRGLKWKEGSGGKDRKEQKRVEGDGKRAEVVRRAWE